MHKEIDENNVMVYPLSQGRASPGVIVLPLSHRGAQYNLSYKKEPYREICGALRIQYPPEKLLLS